MEQVKSARFPIWDMLTKVQPGTQLGDFPLPILRLAGNETLAIPLITWNHVDMEMRYFLSGCRTIVDYNIGGFGSQFTSQHRVDPLDNFHEVSQNLHRTIPDCRVRVARNDQGMAFVYWSYIENGDTGIVGM